MTMFPKRTALLGKGSPLPASLAKSPAANILTATTLTLNTQNLKTTHRTAIQMRKGRIRSTSAMSGKQQGQRPCVQSLRSGRLQLVKMEVTLILLMKTDIRLKQLQNSKIDLNNLPLKNQLLKSSEIHESIK